jgi:dihydropteroate synthase
MLLRARQFEIRFPRPALVMGIVNVTPDSFSDGGQFLTAEAAVRHALELVEQGAEIIDVGGESTRPGAKPVEEAEELRRVMPVIEALVPRVNVPVSIDTMKAGVARAALEAGVSLVNDVAANRQDDRMWRTVAEARAGYVCMHMQGTPQTMQDNPSYKNLLAEISQFLVERMRRMNDCGIKAEQVILDPGIGFGKTAAQNLQLLAGLHSLTKLERPLLIGVSRKSFIGKLIGTNASALRAGSLACACLAVEAGAQIIRSHDVAETVQAVRVIEAIKVMREP